MRTVNFQKDVIWAIAYKMGLDPDVSIGALTGDEAEAYVAFVNIWVRRLWDKLDFPEWTLIEERTPDANHYVAFEQSNKTPIGRVYKVYLRDPATNRGPIDTPFRLLISGIHVGFNHGATVFIKFTKRAPTFTSVPWNAATTYGIGGLVFDPASGNCYSSLQADNTNHAVTDAVWWALVEFPFAICDPVVRGAYSDALREEGQTDKAQAEEQGATTGQIERASVFTSTPRDPLSDQQPPAGGRYRDVAQTA